MSEICIAETLEFPVPPDDAYDFLVSPAAFETFTGWGPIPGIDRLEWQHGGCSQEGSVATVYNTDGSTHRERVVLAARGERYEIAIDEFSSAFRFLVSGARETWVLEPNAAGTLGHREFVFQLRSAAGYPIGLLVAKFFRNAIVRNHQAMLAHLAA